MSIYERYYGKLDCAELYFDENESANRLKTERGYTNDVIEKCKKTLLEHTDCRYCAIRLNIDIKDNTVDFGEFSVDSKSLAKNLSGGRECFIMAVTLGNGVDRLLKKLSVVSVSEHYISDALASALAECAADIAEEKIKGKETCAPRFSVGYGDFYIEKQSDVLKILDAYKMLGISLSKTYLMTPQKTITAVIGIKS